MTETVTRNAEADKRDAAEISLANRRTPNAERSARKRARRRLGLKVRTIVLEREMLDRLEETGFLDPFERGEPKAEEKAVLAALRWAVEQRRWKESSKTS